MKKNRPTVLLSLLFVALTAPASLPAHAGKTYCCTDDRGKNQCGDVLPSECFGRAYREVGANGSVLKQYEAPLTAKQKEEELLAKEEKRKNDALLNTYSSEKDIDFMLQRALTDLAAGTKEAKLKYDEAIKRKQKLDAELEFYKKKPVPDTLKEQIKVNDIEIRTQQLALDAKKKEEDQVRAKFEDDRKRYLELKQGRPGNKNTTSATAAAAPGSTAPTATPTKAK